MTAPEAESKPNDDSADLTEYDRHYLDSVSSSITRARALLMAISLISAWVFASLALSLIRWQEIRTPASYNIVEGADTKLGKLVVTVPSEKLRPSDYVEYIVAQGQDPDSNGVRKYRLVTLPKGWNRAQKETVGGDLVKVAYPVRVAFHEKVDWCEAYRQFILRQWEQHEIDLVGIILDRSDISKSKLTPDVVSRPRVSVPVVGLNVAMDDLHIVGAIILMLAMIWFRFALAQVEDNIYELKRCFSGNGRKERFLKSYLPTRFMFIRRENSGSDVRSAVKSHPSVYYLFFVPYLVVLFGLLTSIHDTVWQVRAYSLVTGSSGVPFKFERILIPEDMVGILTIRWAILLGIAVFLARQAWISWNNMYSINDVLMIDHDQHRRPIEATSHRSQWLALLMVTVIPVIVMTVWIAARSLGLSFSLDMYGWSYGPTFWGALAILGTMAGLIYLLYRIWPKLGFPSGTSGETGDSPDEPQAA